MMDDINAIEFAHEWEAAWNRRDVEAVLKHFHEDAVFTSPLAKHMGFAKDGFVNGKDALRRYWTAALTQNADIRLQVTTVYQGMNTLVIAYKNQLGMDRTEILTFRHGVVIEGHCAFGAS